MRVRKHERGGSTISNILWMAVVVAGAYALYNVVPVYYDHYTLSDRALEFSRLHPSVQGNKDDQIHQKLMKEIRELRLDNYIYQQNVKIQTRETSRAITIEYSREAQVLPGFKHTFNMVVAVDSPFY